MSESNFALATFQETFGYDVVIPLAGVTAFVTLWDIIALVSIQRTRRTPKVAKFLSMSLVVYESLTMICMNTRHFIEDPMAYVLVDASASVFWLLSFLTVGVMAVERFVLFSSSRIYLQYAHFSSIRKMTVVMWATIALVFYGTRLGLCSVFDTTSCIDFVIKGVGGLIFTTILTSSYCFARIFFIIKRFQRKSSINTDSTRHIGQKVPTRKTMKTTGVMFAFLMTTLVCLLFFLVDATFDVEDKVRCLQGDLVIMFNCIVDPSIHICWFKECRVELFNLLACCLPCLKSHVQRRRRYVSNKMYSTHTHSTSCELT